MFFLPDVLLRCMHGRFFGGFVFSDFVYIMETVDFQSFNFSNLGPALVLILIVLIVLIVLLL